MRFDVLVRAIGGAGLGVVASCATDLPVLVDRPVAPLVQHTTGELIHYGADTPIGLADLEWLVGAKDLVDRGPFDGGVLDVGVSSLSGDAIDPGAFASEADLLANARFVRLVANFQRMSLGEADWYDDAVWQRVTANANALATIALRARMRGLFFDPQTNDRQFAFDPASGRTFEETEVEAKRRGQSLMAAIVLVSPEVTILTTLGYVALFVEACLVPGGRDLASLPFGLLPAFLDGMTAALAESRTPARLVDAFLPSYPTNNPDAFRLYYDLMHWNWTAAEAHWVPGLVSYRFAFNAASQAEGVRPWPDTATTSCSASTLARLQRDLPAAFGINVDHESWARGPLRGDANDYRPPAQLEEVVRAALQTSDRYVWLWTSGQAYWPIAGRTVAPVPEGYVEAARAGSTRAKLR